MGRYIRPQFKQYDSYFSKEFLDDTLEGAPLILTFILVVLPTVWFFVSFLKKKEDERRKRAPVTGLVLDKIQVHPIKSCRGIQLTESRYTSEGLEFDRQWVIVDAKDKKCLTARTIANMVLISPEIDKETGTLRVSFPAESKLASFEVDLWPTEEQKATWELLDGVLIWSHATDGYIVPSKVPGAESPSALLSKFMEKEVYFVIKGPTPRPVELYPEADYPLVSSVPEDRKTAFSDGFPFLIISTPSVADVEVKLHEAETGKFKVAHKTLPSMVDADPDVIRRYRPNLVVAPLDKRTGVPYMEDAWGVIEIGEGKVNQKMNRLVIASKCGRCLLPNVSPSTGIRNDALPFKMMTKYRNVDSSNKHLACFGVNAIPSLSKGILRVGDRVNVLRKNDWPTRKDDEDE